MSDRQLQPGIKQSDYTLITSLVLNHYFPVSADWCVAPEQVETNNYKPDFSVFEINLNRADYGRSYPYLTWDVNRAAVISWERLVNLQLWRQCDAVKQNNGRIWAKGQRGFSICLFEFVILKNVTTPNEYSQFTGVNPWQFTPDDIRYLDADPYTELINGVEEVRGANWRVSNKEDHKYIHDMFSHVCVKTKVVKIKKN